MADPLADDTDLDNEDLTAGSPLPGVALAEAPYLSADPLANSVDDGFEDVEQVRDGQVVVDPLSTEPSVVEPEPEEVEENPDLTPAENAEDALPFGDYDPTDGRIQYLRSIGITDGNFAAWVVRQHQSGDRPPTPAEVAKEVSAMASGTYQALYGRAPRSSSVPEMMQLRNAYMALYDEQYQLMAQQKKLPGALQASAADQDFEGRLQDAFSRIGVEPQQARSVWSARLTDKQRKDLSEADQLAIVAKEMLSDLKDLGLPKADLIRLQNQLASGDWTGFEPPPPTPEQVAAAQRAATEPATTAAGAPESGDDDESDGRSWFWGSIQGVPEGLEGNNPYARQVEGTLPGVRLPDTSALEGVPPDLQPEPGQEPGRPSREMFRRQMADAVASGQISQAEADQALAGDELVRRLVAGAPDDMLSAEGVRDMGSRLARSVIDTAVASVVEGMPAVANRLQALALGDNYDPDYIGSMRPRMQYLESELRRYGALEANADLTPDAAARRDRLSEEYQALADAIRQEETTRLHSPLTPEELPGFKATANDIRQWREETFGVPNPNNDDALWAQVSDGLGSGVGYIALATAAGPLGSAARLGTAVFAAATGAAGTAYEEARRAGADEDTALRSAGWSALIATSEIAPIAHMLQRLPDALRGPVSERVAHYVGSIAIGATEESVQETFSGILNNIKDAALYDFDRDVWDGVADDATVGAIVGAILPGVINAPGLVRGRREDALAAATNAVRDPLAVDMDAVQQAYDSAVAALEAGTGEGMEITAEPDPAPAVAAARTSMESAGFDPADAAAAATALVDQLLAPTETDAPRPGMEAAEFVSDLGDAPAGLYTGPLNPDGTRPADAQVQTEVEAEAEAPLDPLIAARERLRAAEVEHNVGADRRRGATEQAARIRETDPTLIDDILTQYAAGASVNEIAGNMVAEPAMRRLFGNRRAIGTAIESVLIDNNVPARGVGRAAGDPQDAARNPQFDAWASAWDEVQRLTPAPEAPLAQPGMAPDIGDADIGDADIEPLSVEDLLRGTPIAAAVADRSVAVADGPAPEDVGAATSDLEAVRQLQADDANGLVSLSPADREALADLVDGAEKVMAAVGSTVRQARESLSAALGADVDAQIAGGAEGGQRRRGRTGRERARQAARDNVSNALGNLRAYTAERGVEPGTIIGTLAGLPNSLRGPLLGTSSRNASEGNELIGSAEFRSDLAQPSSGAPLDVQIEGLSRAMARLDLSAQMLSTVTMSRFVTADGSLDVNIMRRMSQGRTSEAEPLRQLLAARALAGETRVGDVFQFLHRFPISELVTASDRTLESWRHAKDYNQLRRLTNLPLARSTRTEEGRGQLDAVRRMASVVLDARVAERRTRRAKDDVALALNALSAARNARQGGNIRDLIRDVRSSVPSSASQAVDRLRDARATRVAAPRGNQGAAPPDARALREALETHAPNVLLDEDARPLHEMASALLAVNATLPDSLRVGGVLEKAYASQLTNRQLFGSNWQSRRVNRPVELSTPIPSEEDILAPGAPVQQDVSQQEAQEEYVARILAQQIMQQRQLPELRAQLADMEQAIDAHPGADPAASPDDAAAHSAMANDAEELWQRIADISEMSDEQLAEMAMNDFGLDIDTATGVVIRAHELVEETGDDADAVTRFAEETRTIGDQIYRYASDSPLAVSVTGEEILGFDYQATLPDSMVLTSTTPARPGVRVAPGWGLDAVGPLLKDVADALGFRNRITVLPLVDYAADAASTAEIRAALPEAERARFDEVRSRVYDGNSRGVADVSADGVTIYLDPQMDPGPTAATALHELGHGVMYQMLLSARRTNPRLQEDLITAWRLTPSARTPGEVTDAGVWPPIDVRPEEERTPLTPEDRRYYNSFEEWFASQVGQYVATSRAVRGNAVQRLLARIADVWRTIVARLRGQHLPTRLAMANLVRNYVRAGLSEADASRRLSVVQQELALPSRKSGPFRHRTPSRDPGPGEGRRMLSDEDIAALRTEFADSVTTAGVVVKVVQPHRVSPVDEQALRRGGGRVGYRQMTKAGEPATVVVDPSMVRSLEEAVRLVRQQIAVQHDLRGLLGNAGYNDLRAAISDPRRATANMKLSGKTVQMINDLRKEVRGELEKHLDPDEVVPEDSVIDGVLQKLADRGADNLASAEAVAAADLLRTALERQDVTDVDALTLQTLLAGAVSPGRLNTAPDSLPAQRSEAASEKIAATLAFTRNRNNPRGDWRSLIAETPIQTAYRTLFNELQPFIMAERVAEGQAQRAAEAQEAGLAQAFTDMARWAREVRVRMQGMQGARDRVFAAQEHVHSRDAFNKAFAGFMGQLGIRDVAVARAAMTSFTTARATIELNINHALVYGDLKNDQLAAARAQILQRTRAAIAQEQGDNRRRPLESLQRVQELGRQAVDQLKDLITGPQAPANQVKDYIEASKRGGRPFSREAWADFGGQTIQEAADMVRELEARYGGKFMQAFRDSGLDAQLRAMLDQSYYNRVMSGIYGTSGEVNTAIRGTRFYVPLRGFGISQGEFVRDDPIVGEPVPDITASMTGVTGPGTRLQETKPVRVGRQSAATHMDVLDEAFRDYQASVRGMVTNYANGAFLGFARAARDAGVLPQNSSDQRAPIVVGQPVSYVVFQGKDGQRYEVNDDSGTRVPILNPQITHTRAGAFDASSDSRMIFHALPDGRYIPITINDPALAYAMTARLEHVVNNRFGRKILKVLGEVTRIRGRTKTSWNPAYSTLLAPMRDLQENMLAMAGEWGVPASKIASLPVRMAKLVPSLEKFFWMDESGRAERVRKALASPKDPLHNFARRWQANQVQVFGQQLELLNDSQELRDLGITGVVDTSDRTRNPLLRRLVAPAVGTARLLEGHADAMEQAIRQAGVDILEEHRAAQGQTGREAQMQTYLDINSVMDFTQRSAAGRWAAPFTPFVQTTLTGTDAAIQRRIWRGGRPPANAMITEVRPDGKLVYGLNWRHNWREILGSLNWTMMGGLTMAGFLNVLIQGFVLTSGLSLLSGLRPDDEDGLDEETRKQIAALRDRDLVPDVAAEEQSAMARFLNTTKQKLFGPDARADDLRGLSPTRIMSRWYLGGTGEDGYATAPLAYGVSGAFINIGQAIGLITLGGDEGEVTSALTNQLVRNFTPFDAPFTDEQAAASDVVAGFLGGDTLTWLYETLKGETLNGISLTGEVEIGAGPSLRGADVIPTANDPLFLNEALWSASQMLDEAGMGWVVPSGRQLVNYTRDLPVIGDILSDGLRQLNRSMMDNAADGERTLLGPGDVVGWAGSYLLRRGGLWQQTGPTAASAEYYREQRWSGWDRIKEAREAMTTRGAGQQFKYADVYDAWGKKHGGIVGYINQKEGADKRRAVEIAHLLKSADPATRQALQDELGMIQERRRARHLEAAHLLRKARQNLELVDPTVVGSPASPGRTGRVTP